MNNVGANLVAMCTRMLCMHVCVVTGADPGFWERGGLINIFTTGGEYGRGSAPSRDSKGVWGSADSSPSGVWGDTPASFLLLRLFSMKLTVISIHLHVHHAISGLLEPAWIATRKLFILHNAI